MVKNINEETLRQIIEYLHSNGIPFNYESGKFQYEDIRSVINLTVELTIEDIEIISNLIFMVAYLVLKYSPEKEETNFSQDDNILLQIKALFTKKQAEEFLRNINVIYFVRKLIVNTSALANCFEDYLARIVPFLNSKANYSSYYDLDEIQKHLNLDFYTNVFN